MLDHDEVQAALSARLDGETGELDADVVDAHVANCATCRSFWEQSLALSRRLNFVEPVDSGMSPPEDLSEVIIAGVEPEWRKRSAGRLASLTLARVALIVLGILMLGWAGAMILDSGGLVPVSDSGVIDPSAQPEIASLLVETASLRLAVGVGLFFGAWKPRLVTGMLPIVGTLWAFSAGFLVRDFVLGAATAAQAAGLVALLLCLLALGWAWIADRGVYLRQAWRSLNADPN